MNDDEIDPGGVSLGDIPVLPCESLYYDPDRRSLEASVRILGRARHRPPQRLGVWWPGRGVLLFSCAADAGGSLFYVGAGLFLRLGRIPAE